MARVLRRRLLSCRRQPRDHVVPRDVGGDTVASLAKRLRARGVCREFVDSVGQRLRRRLAHVSIHAIGDELERAARVTRGDHRLALLLLLSGAGWVETTMW